MSILRALATHPYSEYAVMVGAPLRELMVYMGSRLVNDLLKTS